VKVEKLRIGVIGVGFIGALHARIFKELATAELVAVTDSNAQLARQRAKELGCEQVDSIAAMVRRKDIDAVSICTPDDYHVEPVLQAAEAGKHILLEKPVARTAADSLAIQQACDRAGVRLMVAHILRFDPKYARVHDEIARGELGEIVHISAKKLNPRLTAQRIKDQTSILFYIGIHEVDIVQWFAGSRISRVYAQKVRKVNAAHGADDCFFVVMNFANGAVGGLEFSWALPANYPIPIECGVEVVGTKGAAHIEVVGQGVRMYKESGEVIPELSVWPEIHGQILGDLRVELEHFVSAVIEKEDFIVSTTDAVDAVRVVEAILSSAERNQPVEIKR
jgi:predicted dehydrogenase